MRAVIVVVAAAALAGCGVETASTAATAAAAKKQEIEQGKKTMEQVQQDIGKAMEQTQQRTQRSQTTLVASALVLGLQAQCLLEGQLVVSSQTKSIRVTSRPQNIGRHTRSLHARTHLLAENRSFPKTHRVCPTLARS